MLSHIKDLLRQRKEGQQRRFFSNHFNRKAQPTVKPDMSDIHFHKNSIRQKKKQQQQQQQQQLQKKSSADNMTIVAMPETDKYAVHAADGLANRLVEADNKRRSQLPSYPGLERFKMIQKLGE
jgi:formyltetrahydrofolate hydrolase